MTWEQVVPDQTWRGGERKRPEPAAKFGENGHLSLNAETVKALGASKPVKVFIDTGKSQIKLEPTTESDLGGWALTGGGNTSFRITLKKVILKYPDLAGEYRVTKQAGAILLVKK